MENQNAKNALLVTAAIFLICSSVFVAYNMFQTPWYKNLKIEATNQPYARTISVDGEGKITAKPDIALVSLSVVNQGFKVPDVTKEGNTKMNSVIESIKKLGVESKDITSTQYNLYPQYAYPENKSPQITGYSLTQEIQIKVRDLNKVDEVLDAGTTAGANQIGQLTFDIDDASKIKNEARGKAFSAAREKAEAMASAAGVKLGRVVTFSEGYMNPYPPMYANYAMDMAKSEAGSVAPTIEPGSKELAINVSVTYEIE